MVGTYSVRAYRLSRWKARLLLYSTSLRPLFHCREGSDTPLNMLHCTSCNTIFSEEISHLISCQEIEDAGLDGREIPCGAHRNPTSWHSPPPSLRAKTNSPPPPTPAGTSNSKPARQNIIFAADTLHQTRHLYGPILFWFFFHWLHCIWGDIMKAMLNARLSWNWIFPNHLDGAWKISKVLTL